MPLRYLLTSSLIVVFAFAQQPSVVSAQQKMIGFGEIRAEIAVGDGEPPGAAVLANLRKNLVTDFVKTRKFAVLDREFGDQIHAEKHPSSIDRSEAGRTAKLSEEATADYLITGAVRRFLNTTYEQEMKMSGRKIPHFRYEVGIAIQVIDVASRRVVYSDAFSENQNGVVQPGLAGFERWADEAMVKIASRACNSVLELIYPLKVASVTESGEIIINEGVGRVSEGDIFEVYALGRALRDPDTGVEIGREESLQGSIKAIRVLPKMAYARSIPTEAFSPITEGSICRKKITPVIPAEPAAPAKPESAPKKVSVEKDL